MGRHEIPAQARDFLARGSVEEWEVSDLELRRHDGVCVCSYRWSERGLHDGEAFEIGGLATDVLVHRDGRWLYQSHHVG